VVVTIETRVRAPRPYLGVAGVAVILAATLVAMELIYRGAKTQFWPVMLLMELPVAALSTFVLGIWSFFGVERSGLSARMWLYLWLASGLAAVVAGLAYSNMFPWVAHLQGPSALVVIAVLGVAAYRTERVAPWNRMARSAWASRSVLMLATVAAAGMEIHLWQLLTPVRDPYAYLRDPEWQSAVRRAQERRERRKAVVVPTPEDEGRAPAAPPSGSRD
jgi:hypothetical protein